MKTIFIKSQQRKYPVYIGKDILNSTIDKITKNNNFDQVVYLIDKTLKTPLKITDKIIRLSISETDKNLKTAIRLIDKFINLKLSKKSLVINIGGGAFTDTANFSETIYKRGINYINCPTTLLAMVDASIGGKNGVNYNKIKNIIGTINQPIAVIIDTNFLSTLPKEQIISGYAEIIKHSLIRDQNYFNQLRQKTLTIEQIIYRSVEIKKQIIEQDEDETKGIRQLLNFGHTIGHSLEAYSHKINQPLLHGYAISLGIIAEAYISVKQKLLDQSSFQKIIEVLKDYQLPTKLNFKIDLPWILDAIAKDKKSTAGKPRFVLLTKIGSAIGGQSVETKIINESLKILCQKQ
ncbi:MAG: 3-dehydroquinate synthase [Patescibacteria group bacterium]|nr:MAG: 3-dehydroquinate synthase [Patescibacteria group bacterium]